MESPERLAISFPAPTPNLHWFLQQEVRKLYFLVVEPWVVRSGLALALLALLVSFPISLCHLWKYDHPFCWLLLPLLYHYCHMVSSPPQLAVSIHPYYSSGWMWLLYILCCWTSIQLDFLAVLGVFCFENSFDLSYGCARRQSMSTYACILAGSLSSSFSKSLIWF